MLLRRRFGHQQENQQADRLLVGRIEADRAGQLEHCRHGSRQALDAAMGNGNSDIPVGAGLPAKRPVMSKHQPALGKSASTASISPSTAGSSRVEGGT